MDFKSVAIIGAGAVGSYVFWGLSTRNDIELCFIADGDRKKRLEKNGLTINGQKYEPNVKTPAEARGTDLLIVTVKYTALESAVKDIVKIADEHTVVMSLMNGIDSEEIIGEAIGQEKVIYSLIKVASERNNNSINFDAEATIGIIYGEKNPAASDERLQALDRLFADTGLHYKSSDSIEAEIWNKFLLNVGNNLIQAIIDVGVGAYIDSEHMGFLKDKLREEVIAIAKARNINISTANDNSLIGTVVRPAAKYSTLQDINAKRHTEIDMFSGALIKMGKELGIPTPYNEYTYHIIKAMEEKNDGKFLYS